MVWALSKGEKVDGKATGEKAKATTATGKTKGFD